MNLINRDPPGRLSCIHAFLKSLCYRFGDGKFKGTDAKHIEGGQNNPIEFCTCSKEYSPSTTLVKDEKKYCPFLRAESSRSYCYLINSNIRDTQKSKAVGEAIQALEALGLCSRTLTNAKRLKYANLTSNGVVIAKYNLFSSESIKYYQKEVVNYGPIIGFLHYLDLYDYEEIRHSEISRNMGRPNNQDLVTLNSRHTLVLNDGDTPDARTRTTGALQAWLTYLGYIHPADELFSNSFLDADKYFSDYKHKLGYNSIHINKDKIKAFFKTF